MGRLRSFHIIVFGQNFPAPSGKVIYHFWTGLTNPPDSASEEGGGCPRYSHVPATGCNTLSLDWGWHMDKMHHPPGARTAFAFSKG